MAELFSMIWLIIIAVFIVLLVGGLFFIMLSSGKDSYQNYGDERSFVYAVVMTLSFIIFPIVVMHCPKMASGEYDLVPLAACIVCTLIILGVISNDKMWEIIRYKFWEWLIYSLIYERIRILRNYYIKTKKLTIEMKTEKWWTNIYCYDNDVSICLIRGVDNLSSTLDFMKIVYENFYNFENFTYKKFIDFAKENDMFVRTYFIDKKPDWHKYITKLLKDNNIFIEPKKLNINTATEQEITNLPFINIVAAKRILKYIENNGDFESFWDFAEFLKLKHNQGSILSKIVYVKPSKQKIDKAEEYDKNLDV